MNKNFSGALFLLGHLALVTGCGGGDSGTAAPVPPIVETNTQKQLTKFWERYGARDSFPAMYVDVVENSLLAEDKVLTKDYQGARTIIDKLLAKYPLSDDQWSSIESTGQSRTTRPHLGEPGVYAHVRMLDDITKIGIAKPLSGSTSTQLTVILPECSDITPVTGPTVFNHRLSPEIEENSFEAVRQSLRLFQSYILAITQGEVRLEANIYKAPNCFQYDAKVGVYPEGPIRALMRQLPTGVVAKSDIFWLIYPSDYSITSGDGGGVLSYGQPVFISEDDWVIKKRADQGGGFRTDVERRIYLAEWWQHEFFHHLFRIWPGLGLERASHQWFDRATWPEDFIGRSDREEDYYSEALNKRLYKATPSIAEGIKQATSTSW
jgi:hypothetical protein